jgi:hypothetical protein
VRRACELIPPLHWQVFRLVSPACKPNRRLWYLSTIIIHRTHQRLPLVTCFRYSLQCQMVIFSIENRAPPPVRPKSANLTRVFLRVQAVVMLRTMVTGHSQHLGGNMSTIDFLRKSRLLFSQLRSRHPMTRSSLPRFFLPAAGGCKQTPLVQGGLVETLSD